MTATLIKRCQDPTDIPESCITLKIWTTMTLSTSGNLDRCRLFAVVLLHVIYHMTESPNHQQSFRPYILRCRKLYFCGVAKSTCIYKRVNQKIV